VEFRPEEELVRDDAGRLALAADPDTPLHLSCKAGPPYKPNAVAP
jgi:hypothetical protein